MNKDNLIKLIDHLKALPKDEGAEVGFNMTQYIADITDLRYSHIRDLSGHNCGTVACIAGHASMLAPVKKSLVASEVNHFLTAMNWLDLTRTEAAALFELTGYSNMIKLRYITLDQAIVTLEKLRDTGEIDWSHILRDDHA